jgi:hypothetical protein
MFCVDPGPVAGYAWPQSVVPGENFGLHISSSIAAFDVEIARVGLTRDVVWRRSDLRAGAHPYPPDFTCSGCDWPVALEVRVGAWRSGYYEIAFIAANRVLSRAFVVVRSPQGAEASILLALSTNTWNAYNDVYNGANLYTSGAPGTFGTTAVSFARPMAPGFLYKPQGFGRRLPALHPPDLLRTANVGYKVVHNLSDWCSSAGWPNWEEPFAMWMERNGYAMDYITNADLEKGDEVLAPYRLLLSVGHDEYWSGKMRDTVERYIADGGNVAFLAGNVSFWQVRLEQSGQQMVCYKYKFDQDPLLGTDREGEVTTIWSDRLLQRPENFMTGVSFTRGGYARIGRRVPEGSGGYTIYRNEHWLLEGTGLEYGDLLGATSTVVGYECDGCDMRCEDGLPYPTGSDGTPTDFEIVASSPVAHFDRATVTRPIPASMPSEIEFMADRVLGSDDVAVQARLAHGHAVLGCFQRGGTVVTTGTCEWVHGLSGNDPRVERVTHNIVKSLGA